jgi:hypothetical protein
VNDTPADDPYSAVAASSSALLGEDWRPVLQRMDVTAAWVGDRHLAATADRIAPVLDTHSDGGSGCPDCAGVLDHCPRWQQVQRIMLAWLLNRGQA